MPPTELEIAEQKEKERVEAARQEEARLEAEKKAKEQKPGLTDQQKLAIFETTAREASTRAAQLENELAEFKRKAKEQPDPSKDEYYNDPVKVTKRLMDEAIAPMRDAVAVFQKDRQYSVIKQKFAGDIRFKKVFAKPEALATVDQMMANQEPTADNMIAALLSVTGAANLGLLPFSFDDNGSTTEEKPPKEDEHKESAHLRPSGSPRPREEGKKLSRQLTEGEKREARKHGITEEQYLNIVDGADEMSIDELNENLKPAEKK